MDEASQHEGARDPRSIPLVIGVGNANRHDDGVGPEVVRRLRSSLSRPERAVAFDGDSTGLLDLWDGEGTVLVVDAVRSGAPSGTIHRVEATAGYRFPPNPTSSTHGLSVAEAVQLGRSIGRFPQYLVVYGVEGVDFSPGIGLSPEVERSVDQVVESIEAEVARSSTGNPRPGSGVRHA